MIYDFDIYCKKNNGNGGNDGNGDVQQVQRDEPMLAHNIVINFMDGNHSNGYCVVIDNFE
jgi:hypothetical protein